MSRPLRMLDPSAIFLATVRCLQGRLFLRPSRETYDVLGGVLARAVRLYGVEIFAFNFASNHLHLIVRAPRGNLPQFMQYLLSNISKKVGPLVKWRGAFWERRYSAQPLLDDAALLEAVSRHEFLINGLRNRDLRPLLYGPESTNAAEQRRRSAAVTRQLRLLRAHGLIHKVPKTHRYVDSLPGTKPAGRARPALPRRGRHLAPVRPH